MKMVYKFRKLKIETKALMFENTVNLSVFMIDCAIGEEDKNIMGDYF